MLFCVPFLHSQEYTSTDRVTPNETSFWQKKMLSQKKQTTTRMWDNVQLDGRPAEYRWRPLFNAAKFGWRPVLECRAVMLPRCETCWNLLGCPQTNEPISAVSGPKFTILWGHLEEILLLNKFFPIIDMCLSCEDTARQSCAMAPRWRFFASRISSKPRAACFRPAS